MMKNFKMLMLFALALFIFGCRTELSNENETNLTQSDFRKTIKLKEALAFKNYLTEIKNNPSHTYSKNEDIFSSLSDEATVTVISQYNVTSYSTVIKHLDRSSDVLVYSVDNENKSIGFIAQYKPADLTKNYQIDNFTGTVEYIAIDGRPMGTRELVNGVPLTPKDNGQKLTANKVACSYSINLIEVNCNGDNHSPSQYGQCTAGQKPYYIVEITEVCPSGGQPPKGLPNMGFYDGGGDGGNGTGTFNEMSIQDSFNFMLSEGGFSELTTDEYTYIQNNQYIGGQLLSYFYNNITPNNEQLLHWSINYFKNQTISNPNNAWNQFLPTINFAQQFITNNPDTTWEQFENWFLGTPEGSDGEYVDPNLIEYETPVMQQPLPSLYTWASNFPKNQNNGFYYQLPSPKVYELVGGSLYTSHLNDVTGSYQNACAIRGSRALLYSGIDIPILKYGNPPKQVTQKGGDGKNYILAATSFNKFMIDKFGDTPYKLEGADANDSQKVKNLLKGKNGIYVIINNSPSQAGYSGHVDTIVNGICIGSAYTKPKGGVKSIRIWILN